MTPVNRTEGMIRLNATLKAVMQQRDLALANEIEAKVHAAILEGRLSDMAARVMVLEEELTKQRLTETPAA